jgi:hypothetical protein
MVCVSTSRVAEESLAAVEWGGSLARPRFRRAGTASPDLNPTQGLTARVAMNGGMYAARGSFSTSP